MAGTSAELYRQYIIDLYNHPLNFYEMKRPTNKASQSNPLCGDAITVFVKVKNGKIYEVSFQGVGCAISRAAASIATKMVKGKSVKKALEISDDELVKALGVDVSPARMKCALLGIRTIKRALQKST